MRTFVFAWFLALSMATDSVLSAGDKEPPKPTLPKGTPTEQVKELIAQHDKAMAAFCKLFDAAKTEEEQEKLEAQFPDPHPYAELLMQIAEKDPNDAAAVDALVWAHRNDRSAKAKSILMRDHLLHAKIACFCWAIRHDNTAESLAALRKVLAENASKEAQASAAVALGIRLRSDAELARSVQKADAKALAKWEERLGKDRFATLKKAEAERFKKEAEQLLEGVTKDKAYALVAIPFGDETITLGELAGRELFEMRSLQPGMIAPEIVGEDIDGKPMKLSDFRGKVVLLDFWGFWCGPCIAMNEHGRSLMKKLDGKPFVIVGVNSDPDREKVKAAATKKGPPWRSFWDGGSTIGPIQNQWNIRAYPTMYLIDHKGTIVARTYPMEEGISMIERTVQKAEADLK